MFSIGHVAISVSDIQKSLEFYKNFGFAEVKSYQTDGLQIKVLALGNVKLELFCYANHKDIPSSALDINTDLQVIGVKHFALDVDDIEKAKQFVIENKLAPNIEQRAGRLGKPYFFFSDPDGILVEIIEKG